jgi:hypothetical protein
VINSSSSSHTSTGAQSGGQHKIVRLESAVHATLLSGDEVYNLLLQQGIVGTNGQFKWDSDCTMEAHEEVAAFLAREKIIHMRLMCYRQKGQPWMSKCLMTSSQALEYAQW